MDTELTPDQIAAEEARARSIEANMQSDGVPTQVAVQEDYFAFDEIHQVLLPDGITFVEHKELTEGQRRKYLNKTNRDVRLQKVSGDAIIRMSPGDERAALLESAITGWNFQRRGRDGNLEPVAFRPQALTEWLDKANPKHIDIVEKAVRQANPWLLAEVSVEEIDKEIVTLQELRETKLREEAGKAA